MEALISYVCFSTSEFSVDLNEYATLSQVAERKKYRRALEINKSKRRAKHLSRYRDMKKSYTPENQKEVSNPNPSANLPILASHPTATLWQNRVKPSATQVHADVPLHPDRSSKPGCLA